jgi:hypothetical protein
LIQEDGGKVAFEFFAQQGCGADYRVVRDEKISSVVVTNPVREEMWKIDSQTGSGPVVSRIIYGVVPAGFVQSVPKVGIASRLERGQAYNVSVQGQGGWGAALFLYHSEGKHSTRN